MGFGSYDENEQKNRQTNTQNNEEENHRKKENDYEGEVSFNIDSVTELLNQFNEVKEK